MSDYIDRQQVIDAVGKEPYVADIDGAPTRVYRDVDVMWELYHLPSAQQWIPCSERLPENDTGVFVYLFDSPSPYIAWIKDTHWYTEDFEVDREDEPIAWMPLPEPYKGGDAE